MVHTCCVVSCSNRQGRDKGRSFYRIIDGQGFQTKELSAKRRSAWLSSINRKNWTPGDGARVCSAHFICGKPAPLYDQANPDWVPTLVMGYAQCEAGSSNVCRYERAKRRKDAAEALLALQSKRPRVGSLTHSEEMTEAQPAEVSEVACQTDESGDVLVQLQEANCSQMYEILELRSQTHVLSPEQLESNPDMLKFYTGIPNWTVFTAVLSLVTPALPSMPQSKLTSFEMIVMFLMKIRLHLFDDDIAYRSSVYRTTVSRTFHKVLDAMAALSYHT